MALFKSRKKKNILPTNDLPIIPDLGNNGTALGNSVEPIKNDDLLDDAFKIVTESGSASISMLQRRLGIGYARAANLIDIMEHLGLVSGFDGSHPRKVLVTYNEWLNRKPEAEKHLLAISEREADYIFERTGVAVDYSNSCNIMKELDNYVIPKSDEDTRIQFINNIIRFVSSCDVKLLLFDESLSFLAYEGLPHLYVPIVNDAKKAVNLITKWLPLELGLRKVKCGSRDCRDIESYNRFAISDEDKMQHIIMIVSEFYSIKNAAGLDEALIPVLLNGKQLGIHLILFSKFGINNLSLGAKADLLKVGNADDLQRIFTRNTSLEHIYSISEIDNGMDGYQFEKFCGDILAKNGFSKIQVTQASADYGADIIAYKEGVKYAIQCKKYSSPVGISAVQEVIASKSMYDCHVAVVLTNNSFTNSAINLAEKNGVLLWGRDKLIPMMNQQ